MISVLPRTFSVIFLLCLANAVQAEEQISPIHDDAKIFQVAALEGAEQSIASIRHTLDRNVYVRTVATASPRQRRWLSFLRTPKVDRMLEAQARQYADECGVPGIYVVLCTHPRDVHVIVRPEDDQAFTRRDAEALRRTTERNLHDRGPDAALLGLVNQIEDVLQDHARRGPTPILSSLALAGLLGGGLALWLLLRMIRFRMRSRAAATWSAGSVSDPKTQTRETAALLGAMFGFHAGLWIYDKLYPCPPGASPSCGPPVAEEEKTVNSDGAGQPLPEHAEDAPVSS